jgi:hypothetical protein
MPMSSTGGKNQNRPNGEEAAPTAGSGAGAVGPAGSYGGGMDVMKGDEKVKAESPKLGSKDRPIF